jgi:AhpD family alkylhydroperoxidase
MTHTQPRFRFTALTPGADDAIAALDSYVETLGLEPELLELVRLRASQINGCAYCVDMHTKDACARGETEQRLYATVAWRETPFFTPRERAALAWTEAVTRIPIEHPSDALYEETRAQLGEAGTAALTLAIIAINSWNRYAITQRSVVGGYVSPIGRKAERERRTEEREAVRA